MDHVSSLDDDSNYKSMTARTYKKLREAIIVARFRPGEKLRIDSLKEEFEASLGAVREALSALASEGLVNAEPQRGFTVSLVSRQDLIDLTEARVTIELICLRSSIEHGDLDWEGRVISGAHQLLKLSASGCEPGSKEFEKWYHYHDRFHEDITSACTNMWWLKLRHQLYLRSERYRRLAGPGWRIDRDISREHSDIAEEVVARNADRACALLERHLLHTKDILLGSPMVFLD